MNKPRVRFAPSPTGPLHIGGVRTALYNYLFAKQNGGDFILRIEDTDSARFVEGAEQYIVETFNWLGIKFDEGVHVDGPCGPYRQSERRHIYKKYVDELLTKDLAYIAFDTPEELEEMRKRLEADKSVNPQYDANSRMSMRNSLTMSKDEVKMRIQSGEKYVVRIKVEPNIQITVNDLIRGAVTVNSSILDDKVLYKSSDDLPTYHMANIVDDHLMKITHVIRGEEWLPSAPLHVLLYSYLGWENTMPQFAHLPLLLRPDGNGKLSKRDGDRLGFPVFPLQWKDPKTGEISSGYRESGYYPEAVINMLALLGWNPGTEQELFSLEELVKTFSLERVSKSGAKFNLEKAKWFNNQYLQHKSNAELAIAFAEDLKTRGITTDIKVVENICGLIKERVSFPNELWDQAFFFFEAPIAYDEKVIKKRWSVEMPGIIERIIKEIESCEPFFAATLEEQLKAFIETNQLNLGQVMNCLRLAIVGTSMGPHLFDIMEIIGKNETINRLDKASKEIKN